MRATRATLRSQVASTAGILLAFFASTGAALSAPALPAGEALWLRSADLPKPGAAISSWKNAARKAKGPGAELDASKCYPGYPWQCSSAPTSVSAPGGARAASFATKARIALGNNLIVAGDHSNSSSYSVFYVSAASSGGRLLASQISNWLIGSWSPGGSTTLIDRAYVDSSRGDPGWLASGSADADGLWRLYGLTVAGAAQQGCAWKNTTALGCGAARGPNVLRLGGGMGSEGGLSPAEFGTGLIAEVVAYNRELSAAEVFEVAAYYMARFPSFDWGA